MTARNLAGTARRAHDLETALARATEALALVEVIADRERLQSSIEAAQGIDLTHGAPIDVDREIRNLNSVSTSVLRHDRQKRTELERLGSAIERARGALAELNYQDDENSLQSALHEALLLDPGASGAAEVAEARKALEGATKRILSEGRPRGDKILVVERLFDERWDPETRTLSNPLVTLEGVKRAIQAHNLEHPGRKLSELNLANFFKDFVRKKLSAKSKLAARGPGGGLYSPAGYRRERVL